MLDRSQIFDSVIHCVMFQTLGSSFKLATPKPDSGILSSLRDMFSWLGCFPKKNVHVIMLGLDGAGKTTMLYKLKTGETVTTIPTIGFNVEEMVFGHLKMVIYDIGGSKLLWKHYYTFANALIFVVDVSSISRLKEARDALQEFLDQEELKAVKLLFVANKRDVPGALTNEEFIDAFNLKSLTDREWFVQSTNARTGEGLQEGMKWLQTVI